MPPDRRPTAWPALWPPVPADSVGDDRVEIGVAWLPAELLVGLARVRHQHRRIAGPPPDLADRHRAAGRLLHRGDHLPHRAAAPGAEVQVEAGRSLAERRQGQQVCLSQVEDVNVVSHRGAVRRGVVGPEDRQRIAATVRRLDRQRDEVRLRRMILADVAVGIGAGGVEVAQRRVAEAVGLSVPAQHSLDGQLGLAVRVDRVLGMALGDRNLPWLAVGRAGRGEDQIADADGDHRVQQVDRPRDVVAKVLPRIGHRLAHVGVGGEVDHRLHGVLGERLADGCRVGEIALHERSPLHRGPVTVDQVVEDDRAVARGRHQLGGMATDVAGAADDQDGHAYRIPFFQKRRKFFRSSSGPGFAAAAAEGHLGRLLPGRPCPHPL